MMNTNLFNTTKDAEINSKFCIGENEIHTMADLTEHFDADAVVAAVAWNDF